MLFDLLLDSIQHASEAVIDRVFILSDMADLELTKTEINDISIGDSAASDRRESKPSRIPLGKRVE